MGLCLEEQETIIRWGRNDKGANIFTSDGVMINRLDKRVSESEHYTLDEVFKDSDGTVYAKSYTLDDKKMISLRGKKRIYSEEEKQVARERFLNSKKMANGSLFNLDSDTSNDSDDSFIAEE